MLASGECSYAEVAKRFKVSKATLVARFSDRVQELRSAATALATAELTVENMPVSDRVSVRTLADQIKGIGVSLAGAAAVNAETSRLLAEAANVAAKKVVMQGGVINVEEAKATMALVATSNEAGKLGMGLLTANKDKGNAGAPTLEDLVVGGEK